MGKDTDSKRLSCPYFIYNSNSIIIFSGVFSVKFIIFGAASIFMTSQSIAFYHFLARVAITIFSQNISSSFNEYERYTNFKLPTVSGLNFNTTSDGQISLTKATMGKNEIVTLHHISLIE